MQPKKQCSPDDVRTFVFTWSQSPRNWKSRRGGCVIKVPMKRKALKLDRANQFDTQALRLNADDKKNLLALEAALGCVREMRDAAYVWVRSQPAEEGWDTSEYVRGEPEVENDLAGWSDQEPRLADKPKEKGELISKSPKLVMPAEPT